MIEGGVQVPEGAALTADGVSSTAPQQRTVLDSLVRLSVSSSRYLTTCAMKW